MTRRLRADRRWLGGLMILSAGAALTATLSPLAAQTGRPMSVKAIMIKANKPNGVFPAIAAGLKADAPGWDVIQKQSAELTGLAEGLCKTAPPGGDRAGWDRLCKDYLQQARDLETAVAQRNRRAALDAHRRMTNACAGCHDAHRN